MNEVHVRLEAARKEQLAICLRQMEGRFDDIVVQKRERLRTQYGVPTNHLADIGGPNSHHRQPRPRYAKVECKFIIENEPINHFAGRGVWRKFPTTQAHAIPREVCVKLDTLGFQGCLQPK
jgi:hypothetical protein